MLHSFVILAQKIIDNLLCIFGVKTFFNKLINFSKNILSVYICILLTIGISFVLYSIFYNGYMPAQLFSQEMNIDFIGCKDRPGPCSSITANCSNLQQHAALSPGQMYKIGVEMRLPLCDKNLNLGMFMSCLSVFTASGSLMSEKCKSSVLEYKSKLLMLLDDLFFLPLSILGAGPKVNGISKKIIYFSDLNVDVHDPIETLSLEIKSTHIEIYSIKVEILAQFSGLRHFLSNFPVTSSAMGVSFVIIILTFTFILPAWRLSLKQNQAKTFNDSTCRYQQDSEENFIIKKVVEIKY